MRAFIVLCLLAVSCSADKLGYNYQPVAHADEGLSFLPGGGQVIGELPSQVLPVQSGEAVLSQPIEAPIVPQIAPLVEEFQKEFYSYAAPEEQYDEGASNQQIANSLKKNLRVVFIRTPENQGFERAALQLAKQSAQQETAIYVLTKQSDVSNLAKQLNALKTSSTNKPEVHFVKYRTPEDAANAQLAIQNQYNQLPGVSRISNEGRAPVLNFASSPVQAAAIPAVAPAAPSSEYLPANVVAGQDYLPPTLSRFRVK
ncbi:uncharacterized protein LOC6729761 [Drosophila simulans]|uniref:GD21297 n=1 Tax=Drosophila simulans TaxID=7240 RepID=B4QWQ3_DROSI|nr:uncharacterized protein LOC6729761 [Drosophila simulans]EDX14570.1 GD21297 [Drosophila simulans]KMZ06115.1 uncharacterized protein Dsimw501_GD21297 [Drosophila simulans]